MSPLSPFKLIQRKYHQVQIGIESKLGLLFNLDRQVPAQWRHGLLFRAPSTTSHYLLTTPSHIDPLYPHCLPRQVWHTNTEEDNIRSHWTMDFCKRRRIFLHVASVIYITQCSLTTNLLGGWSFIQVFVWLFHQWEVNSPLVVARLHDLTHISTRTNLLCQSPASN